MSKTIIITGANGNLGVAAVKQFLDKGYGVAAVCSSVSRLEFAISNPLFEWKAVDLTDEKATRGFVNELADRKKIEGALALAGGFAMGSLEETDQLALHKMFALNFETAFHLTRALFPRLMENGYGRIILVGARSGLPGEQGKNTIAYSLSKSLLFKYAELLNQQAGKTNVVTSVFTPSIIDTPPNRQNMPEAHFEDWVSADDIAALMEIVCSEKGNVLREPVFKVYHKS
ncbi:MAG: SDR family NAD(P)-dependent oxidoreductase [Chitinophagaceae bacterium]|nr:SDR family NAD(P)-dependent oxidoreductase [Chitinophagaceae bacterium]